jgi:hypothetical protein
MGPAQGRFSLSHRPVGGLYVAYVPACKGRPTGGDKVIVPAAIRAASTF